MEKSMKSKKPSMKRFVLIVLGMAVVLGLMSLLNCYRKQLKNNTELPIIMIGNSGGQQPSLTSFLSDTNTQLTDKLCNYDGPQMVFDGDRYCKLRVSPDGSKLLASHLCVLLFPDLANKPSACEVLEPSSNYIKVATFTNEGDIITYDSTSNILRKYNKRRDVTLKHVEIESELKAVNMDISVSDIYMTSEGSIVLVYCQCLFLLKENDNSYSVSLRYTPLAYEKWCGTAYSTNSITCLDYNSGEKLFLLGLGSGEVVVLDSDFNEMRKIRIDEEKAISGSSMSVYFIGKSVNFAARNAQNGNITEWNARSGKLVEVLSSAKYGYLVNTPKPGLFLTVVRRKSSYYESEKGKFQIWDFSGSNALIWESEFYDIRVTRAVYLNKINVVVFSNGDGIFALSGNE